MTFPQNEEETVALFKLVQHRLGWRIVHLQTRFPDAIIENDNGQRLVAEFEYEAKNFRAHGHDPAGCDLIIAYHNEWEDPPVPVWALEEYVKDEVAIIREVVGQSISYQCYADLSEKYSGLKEESSKLKARLAARGDTMLNLWYFCTHKPPAACNWSDALAFLGLGIGLCMGFQVIVRFLGTQ